MDECVRVRPAAVSVGDPKLISRCVLHFLYVNIQEGKFTAARQVLRWLTWFGKATGVRGLTSRRVLDGTRW